MATMDSTHFILSQQERWREQLVDRLVWLLLLIALPLLLYTMVARSALDWAIPLVLYALLVIIGLLRHQFVLVRAVSLCMILFTVGILAIFNHGLKGSGSLFLGISVIFSCALINPRFGIAVFLGSSVIYGIIGIAVLGGYHRVSADAVTVSSDSANWVLYWGSYVLVIGMGLAVGIYLYSRITKTITKLHGSILRTDAAEKAELAGQQHFRFLTENLAEVVWTMDLDMNFTYISPSVQTARGYTPEEATALGTDNFVDPESINQIGSLLREQLKQDSGADPNHPVTIELALRHKDGGSVDSEIQAKFIRDDDGTPIGVIGATRDISERTRLQTAIESVIHGTQRTVGTDFFNSLAENLAAVLNVNCVLVGERQENDTIKTLCVWMQDKFQKNFSYTLLGTPGEHIDARSICAYAENVQQEFPNDRILRDMDAQSFLGTSLVDSDGKNIGVLVCMDDKPIESLKFCEDLLTIFSAYAGGELSRRQALEGSEVTRRQLLQSQKMESIGQMAGGLAHDFNNLLVVIKGYADLAQERTPENSKLSGYHKQILNAADRATDLTRQLLSFSSRQIMETEPLDLNNLMIETANLLPRLLPENITYEFNPGDNIGTIDGDFGQLQQSVINLAVNARDAMPDGGKLSIETSNININANYVKMHPSALVGDYVLLRVSDTGSGIPKEIQEFIFEPFFTTKREGLGTGLGLSVLFGVIKQHGGFIHLSSDPGRGTEFRIYLPIVGSKASTNVAKPVSEIVHGDETLLLVEDDKQVRALANTFLKLAGYEVILAEDGEMAIEMFQKYQEEISLVVLDVVLPKIGGRQVMEEIYKLAPGLPILFCSGYSSDGIHTNFILEDDLVLLQKPYSRDNLLRKVREMLD